MTYNLPAVRWLAKKDPEAALAVLQRIRDESCNYGAEVEPGYLDPRDRSADDMETHVVPDEPLTSETMTEPVQDGPDEVYPEMLHEEQPSERDICQALGWIEWPRTGRSNPIGWAMRCACGRLAPPEGRLFPSVASGDNKIEVAGLTYYTRPDARRGKAGGMLLHWTDPEGNIRRPSFRADRPRGGKRPYRLDPARYLALKPVTPAPMDAQPYQRPMSIEPALMPMYAPLLRKEPDALDPYGRYGVEEARAELRAFGVDGSVAFDDLPFPATKCPTAIVKGARFIGGISGRSQTASPGVIGKIEEPAKLEARVEGIVDEVASRGTLESIGVKLGYRGGYADRAGGKALLEAGKVILAANDNNLQKLAA
jgi:hypothetical protein